MPRYLIKHLTGYVKGVKPHVHDEQVIETDYSIDEAVRFTMDEVNQVLQRMAAVTVIPVCPWPCEIPECIGTCTHLDRHDDAHPHMCAFHQKEASRG